MAQKEYKEYLENTIGNYYTSTVPNKDRLKTLLQRGADINSLFLDKDIEISRQYSRTNFSREMGATLLYSLVRKLKSFPGKKYDAALDLIKFVLAQPAINPDIGLYKLENRGRSTGRLLDTPMMYAINDRIPNVIKLLVDRGAYIPDSGIQKWKSYSLLARSQGEQEKLQEIGKLLGVNYAEKSLAVNENRSVPYNAVNVISREDIRNGNILVDINKEYDYGYYYLKNSWDKYEASKGDTNMVRSPITRKPITSRKYYRAELLGPQQTEENFAAIQTNLFEGGKRKTRKLKIKRRNKTSKQK
jgi:hypothetical protein